MVEISVRTFKQGQSVAVVIPKEVREPLGIGLGDDLLADVDKKNSFVVFKKKKEKRKKGEGE